MKMKKTIVTTLALMIAAVMAFAAEEEPFTPLIPQIMGQGGSLNASAQGYTSFFTNPAGFSRSPGELTIAADTWVCVRPDRLMTLGMSLGGSAAPQTDVLSFINDEVTGGGFGVGALAGVGWAGKGLGIGAFLMIDSYLWGPTLLGITGDLTATAAFILGVSVPLHLGPFTIHAGGDLRPMIRIRTLVDSAVAGNLIMGIAEGEDLFAALNSSEALHGMGLALDLGIIAELGGLSFGVSARDFGGTTFSYGSSEFGTVMESMMNSMRLPEGTAVADPYTVPMDLSAGVAFHPDMGRLKWLVDPTIHMELSDVIGVIRDQRTPWTLLHIGAQAKLLSVLIVEAGLDQGYLTAGAGVHLLFLDAQVAMFTRELGEHIGDRPSSGLSLEVAIRF
jgi:hypothetical protein